MNAQIDQHPADDVLVRVLDSESPPDELALTRVHIDGCAVCARRLRTLEHRAHAMSALLRATDPAMPAMQPPDAASSDAVSSRSVQPRIVRHGADRTWLKAAAVLLVVAGVGVLASPARARVLDWLREAIGLADDPVAAPAPPAVSGDPASIEFEYAGADLIVEITDATAGGELRLRSHDAGSVTARALEPTARIDMLVLPTGLRIRNDAARADYEIALPASVARVQLRMGGSVMLVIEADALPCTVPIPGRVARSSEGNPRLCSDTLDR